MYGARSCQLLLADWFRLFVGLKLYARVARGRGRRPELLYDLVVAICGWRAQEALSGVFLASPFCTGDLWYVMSQRHPVRDRAYTPGDPGSAIH